MSVGYYVVFLSEDGVKLRRIAASSRNEESVKSGGLAPAGPGQSKAYFALSS